MQKHNIYKHCDNMALTLRRCTIEVCSPINKVHSQWSPCYIDAYIGPSSPRFLSITRKFQNGIELNWLPPTDPNGEVHYVIYYTPQGGTKQSIDTGSNLTHHNVTGLERNRVYTNIAVQAVNSAGGSGSRVLALYNHTPPGKLCAHAKCRCS